MNEQECQAAYEQLSEILRDIRMDWVVQLAAEGISTGEICSESNENTRPRKNTLPDIQVGEYTAKEKVKILINYIKQAIVDTRLMQKKIVNFFDNQDWFENLNPSIAFTSDTDEYSVFTHSDALEIKTQEAEELLELLEQLTRRINSEF